jgi:hypothetical protein
VSSFPIAVVANFARVFAMALFFRLGYKQITQGLEHMMAGFVIMLPLAFCLLYLEMKVLDLGERLIRYAGEGDEPPPEKAGPAPPRGRPDAV